MCTKAEMRWSNRFLSSILVPVSHQEESTDTDLTHIKSVSLESFFFFFFNLTWGRTSLSHWRLLAAQHHLLNVAGSRRHAQRNVFRADSYSNLIRVQMRVRTFFMIDYKSTMTEHEMSVYLRDDCANSSSPQRTCYLTNENSIILYSTSCWLKIRWKFSNQRNISQVSQPNGLEGSLWDHILIWKDVIHTLVAWSSLFGHFRMHANVISLAGTVKISVFVKKKKKMCNKHLYKSIWYLWASGKSDYAGWAIRSRFMFFPVVHFSFFRTSPYLL